MIYQTYTFLDIEDPKLLESFCMQVYHNLDELLSKILEKRIPLIDVEWDIDAPYLSILALDTKDEYEYCRALIDEAEDQFDCMIGNVIIALPKLEAVRKELKLVVSYLELKLKQLKGLEITNMTESPVCSV